MNPSTTNFSVPHFGDIPLACVIPSKTNPRKHFDEAELADLAASIKELGVAQPILVRPLPTSPDMIDCVEIVAGERRFRASKLAGLERIPAIVRELTDSQALEIQVVENLQRRDVHPIEEAEGYDRLMKEHGYSAEQIADKVGKSKPYIYGRIKLLSLVPEAREAFFNGSLSASIAERLARMPVPSLQKQATEEIINNFGQKEPMSFRKAAEHLQARYMLDLSSAKFSIKDAKLVTTAGACGSCKKRTGNDPILYPDVDADVCTDPDCFESKVDAHNARKVAAAKKSGLPIYSANEAYDKLQANDQVAGYSNLYQLERPKSDSGYKRIEDALPNDKLPKPVAYVEQRDGEMAPVFEKTAVQEAMEKAGLCKTLDQHNAEIQEKLSGAARSPKQSEEDKKARAELRAREKKAEAESKFRRDLHMALREQVSSGKGHLEALRAAAIIMAREWCFPSKLKDLYAFNVFNEKLTEQYIGEADLSQVILFILEITLGEDVFNVTQYEVQDDDHLDHASYLSMLALAKVCDIDADAMRIAAMPAVPTTPPAAPEEKPQAKTAKGKTTKEKKAAKSGTVELDPDSPIKGTIETRPDDTEPGEVIADGKNTPDPAVAWPFPTGANR